MPKSDEKELEELEEEHDDGAGDDGENDSLASRILEGVRELVAPLTSAGGAGDDDDGGGEGDGGDDDRGDKKDGTMTTPAPASSRQTEADFEEKVRGALSRVRREEETESRLDALEKKTPPEAPPVKLSKLTRLIWGDK